MATTRTGQPNSQGQGTMGSENTLPSEGSDRRAAGEQGGIAETLRATTYRKLDDQKSRASETLGSVAGAVRGMTQPLRESGQAGMAEYVDKAAEGIERWASRLRERDVDDAVHAVQNFARRQPALFLGIAFGAGVIAARFLKSSAEDRGFENQSRSGGAWGGSSGAMRNDFGSRGYSGAGGGMSGGGMSGGGMGSGGYGGSQLGTSRSGESQFGTSGSGSSQAGTSGPRDTSRLSSDSPSSREES